jgi:hypothetical protein
MTCGAARLNHVRFANLRDNVDLVFGSRRTYRRAGAHPAAAQEEDAMRQDMPSQDRKFK